MVMVSVVIPLYNKAASIQRTLDSVYRQTVSEIEIVVVNDGSTDEGPEIVARQTDPRVLLIHRPNGGQAAARNSGMGASSGQIIAFLDGDDAWLPGHVESLLGLAHDFPDAEVFATGYVMISSAGRETAGVRACERGYLDYFRAFAYNPSPVLTCSSTALKRSVLANAGGFDEDVSFGVDLHFWARLALVSRVAFNPVNTAVYYHQTAGNLSARRNRHRDPRVVISPSVDYLVALLKRDGIPETLTESVTLYNQATILKSVKANLARSDKRRALSLLWEHWSKRHFVTRGLGLLLLCILPDSLWKRILGLWKRRHDFRPPFLARRLNEQGRASEPSAL